MVAHGNRGRRRSLASETDDAEIDPSAGRAGDRGRVGKGGPEVGLDACQRLGDAVHVGKERGSLTEPGRRAGGVSIPIVFVDLDLLLRKEAEAMNDGPLFAAHRAQGMLEPGPDLDSLSDSCDTLVEANDVLAKLVDLEAVLPREPGSRSRPVASVVQRTWIALGTRKLDISFRCHFLLLFGNSRLFL